MKKRYLCLTVLLTASFFTSMFHIQNVKANDREHISHLHKKTVSTKDDFTLTDIHGKKYQLSQLKGKKVYIKFWASWCSICLSSLSETDKLAKTGIKDTIILSVVSPNFNGEKDEKAFKKWYNTLNYKNLPVLLDNDGKIAKHFGVRAYPTSLFFDKDGKLSEKHLGFINNEETTSILTAMK